MKTFIKKNLLNLGLAIMGIAVLTSSPAFAVKENNTNPAACFGQLRAAFNKSIDRNTLKGQNAELVKVLKKLCKEPAPTPDPEPVVKNGGYPDFLADAPYTSIADPWGYYNRTSPSYAAFKVYQYTGYAPMYYGDAKQWPASAAAKGKTVSTTPTANSVGISTVTTYGHAVWVEKVNSDNTLDISQYDYYNAGGPGWGNYSEMRVRPAAFEYYITF